MQKNMSLWAALYNGTSKADIMIIENCNNDNSLIPKALTIAQSNNYTRIAAFLQAKGGIE